MRERGGGGAEKRKGVREIGMDARATLIVDKYINQSS